MCKLGLRPNAKVTQSVVPDLHYGVFTVGKQLGELKKVEMTYWRARFFAI